MLVQVAWIQFNNDTIQKEGVYIVWDEVLYFLECLENIPMIFLLMGIRYINLVRFSFILEAMFFQKLSNL